MTKIYYADRALGQDDVLVLERRRGDMVHSQAYSAETGINARQLADFVRDAELAIDRALASKTERCK